MPKYNLLEYGDNYSMTSGSLWNYYRDETNGDANKNNAARNRINNKKTITSKSFEYKTKLIGRTPNNNMLIEEVVVSLKCLSKFWRFLDLLLINCEIEFDLLWSKECIISEISITPVIQELIYLFQPRQQTTGATFQTNNAKLYVPVVKLSTNYNNKFIENIKQGFKRIIYWNKCRSEITTQPKNNNLDYLINPAFKNINRLVVISLKNRNADPTRDSFDKYYMSSVEIKCFNALSDNEPGKFISAENL